MFNLLENEKILSVQRRHWFLIFSDAVSVVGMAALPFAGLVAIAHYFPAAMETIISDYTMYLLFYCAAWLLICWMLFFVQWTNYFLDVFVITNKRIIYVDQFKLFSRAASELRLERVQDIEVRVSGIIPSFLKMGDLYIQTAGSNEKVAFKGIPYPYNVKTTISQLCEDVHRTYGNGGL